MRQPQAAPVEFRTKFHMSGGRMDSFGAFQTDDLAAPWAERRYWPSELKVQAPEHPSRAYRVSRPVEPQPDPGAGLHATTDAGTLVSRFRPQT